MYVRIRFARLYASHRYYTYAGTYDRAPVNTSIVNEMRSLNGLIHPTCTRFARIARGFCEGHQTAGCNMHAKLSFIITCTDCFLKIDCY